MIKETNTGSNTLAKESVKFNDNILKKKDLKNQAHEKKNKLEMKNKKIEERVVKEIGRHL